MKTLVLIHGAGSGPWVFEGWLDTFRHWTTFAVDLQQGLDVGKATMGDYAQAVVEAARALPAPLALCGWSMGGLVALQAAQHVRPAKVVLLEASPPAEVQGFDPGVELTEGTFDPQEVYGAFPDGVLPRPESSLARAERKRGISVPSLPCASLVIAGESFRVERGEAIAQLYGSELMHVPGLDHWQLLQSDAVQRAVSEFLEP